MTVLDAIAGFALCGAVVILLALIDAETRVAAREERPVLRCRTPRRVHSLSLVRTQRAKRG